MAALTVQNIVAPGLSPAYAAAAAGGDTISVRTDERDVVHIKNGGAGAVTVTVAAVSTSVGVPSYGTLAVPDMAVSIPAGEERFIGPFPHAYINSIANVSLTYSGVTTVTVAAIRLPKSI